MKNYREIFNPSKITICGKSYILTTQDGNYVVKEKVKDLKSLYNYLENRSFNKFPKIIDEYDNNYVYEYLDDINEPINQKMIDEAKTLAELHYKTSYFKNVKIDNFKEIYENISSNINYLEDYYNKLFDKALSEEYIRPSLYILIINSSLIRSNISFLKRELEKWYKMINDLDKIRVVYNHNNLSIDHFINNKFISWDKYLVDSPVIDLINLYKNDFNKYDFSLFLNEYFKHFELLDYEKTLLFIMISMPKTYDFGNNELDNTIMVSKSINYIEYTNKLIRPYYSK